VPILTVPGLALAWYLLMWYVLMHPGWQAVWTAATAVGWGGFALLGLAASLGFLMLGLAFS
jgi:Trk-type K+ transport system membrane component